MELTNEMMKKAMSAKSADELIKLAVENGIELSQEEALEKFNQLHQPEGEIEDDELDNVAGGCGAFETKAEKEARRYQESVEKKICPLCSVALRTINSTPGSETYGCNVCQRWYSRNTDGKWHHFVPVVC